MGSYDQTDERIRWSVKIQVLENYADAFDPAEWKTAAAIKGFAAVARDYWKLGEGKK
jgi:hypothetical protein